MPLTVTPSVGLEQLVRPFLPKAGRPDRARVYLNGGANSNGETTNTEGEEIPTLAWEAMAPPQVVTLPSMGFTVDLGGEDQLQEEQDREVHVERIFSDDNPEAYIDVQVIDDITFKDPRTKLNRRFKLNN